MEGSTSTDSGAMISDGVKALEQIGVCPETTWPYKIERFADKPTDGCYVLAHKHLYNRGFNIDNTDLDQMRSAIYHNNPFAVGIAVYESFESQEVANTGVVTMPNTESEHMLGGHAISVVGYNDLDQTFIARNSWGDSWGDKGYFYIPYGYLLDTSLSSDAWSIDI